MHIKKRAEDDIRKVISELVSAGAKIKINTKVEIPDKPEIKGKNIPGIKNIVAVASGKGGVGKSSIAASLAVAFSKDKKIVCADCDVDASNLSLLFSLSTDKYKEWNPLSTNQIALVDRKK
jgi:ATP-binding protein involved in chromosome partitioning